MNTNAIPLDYEQPTVMTAEESAARCMASFTRDGSFQSLLGRTYLAGTREQRALIVSAFPEVFEKWVNFKDRRYENR